MVILLCDPQITGWNCSFFEFEDKYIVFSYVAKYKFGLVRSFFSFHIFLKSFSISEVKSKARHF